MAVNERYLEKLPYWAKLRPEEQDRVRRAAVQRHYARGQLIYDTESEMCIRDSYKTYLLGIPQEASKIMATWAAGATAFNAVVGTVVVVVVYAALRPILKKTGYLYKI